MPRTTEEIQKDVAKYIKYKNPPGYSSAKVACGLMKELSAKLREREGLVKVVEDLSKLHGAIDNHTKESLYQWIHVLGRDAIAALTKLKPTPPKKED